MIRNRLEEKERDSKHKTEEVAIPAPGRVIRQISKPGLTWWVWDSAEVKEVEYEETLTIGAQGVPIKRVPVKEGCYYRQALNYTSAVNLFVRLGLPIIINKDRINRKKLKPKLMGPGMLVQTKHGLGRTFLAVPPKDDVWKVWLLQKFDQHGRNAVVTCTSKEMTTLQIIE